ncbi:hypothetical protein GSI_07845 [Ganoderma sinense ZZ0214-1]|uniref:Uncharacterized protein n=1 Tax=Ganoderma sinense ZZ0214-1 TaxID=1077348 RepID=A0A2G8S868_9APHY|nr:hypothetical protein GSI_07845 [Ganoderma sinense ZZ0214-1]
MDTWDPPSIPYLSQVIFADLEWYMVHYYVLLFSSYGPCIQIVPKGLLQVYPVEVFESLYLQCAPVTSSNLEADLLRLSIAVYAFEEDSPRRRAVTSLSIMLATSTRLVRITLCPYLLGHSYYEVLGAKWRDHVLALLRTLPGLRELWLTDTDTDTDVHSSSAPLWDFPTPDGLAAGDEPTIVFPSLDSVVIVYDCSAALRRLHPDVDSTSDDGATSIQPSISALRQEACAGPGAGPMSTCPNLAHVHLAIGYDPTDLPRLRDAWRSTPWSLDCERPFEEQARGRVDLSAKLLRELASEQGKYAYVRRAALWVQLMPHLALDAGELGWLRALFAAAGGDVRVEEIDCLPGMPVPEHVRDGALDMRGFVPGSVLC